MKSILNKFKEAFIIDFSKVIDGFYYGIGFTVGIIWVLKVFTDLEI